GLRQAHCRGNREVEQGSPGGKHQAGVVTRMKRRDFITLLGGAAAWPLAARAQQRTRLPTIGFLGTVTPDAWSPFVAAFVQRLRELGWVDGRTIAVEYRWADARNERFAEIAAEFVQLKTDIIVTAASAVPAVSRHRRMTESDPDRKSR